MINALAAVNLAAPIPTATSTVSDVANWQTVLALFIIMVFVLNPYTQKHSGDGAKGKLLTIVGVLASMMMAAVLAGILAESVGFIRDFNGWVADSQGPLDVGLTLGPLILAGFSYALMVYDVPFLPELLERGIAAILVVIGGVLMIASPEWVDMIGAMQAIAVDIVDLIVDVFNVLLALIDIVKGAFS